MCPLIIGALAPSGSWLGWDGGCGRASIVIARHVQHALFVYVWLRGLEICRLARLAFIRWPVPRLNILFWVVKII